MADLTTDLTIVTVTSGDATYVVVVAPVEVP